VIRTSPPGARPISEVLEQARSRLDRLEPAQAWAAMQKGALLVDIRPEAQRGAEGQVPGALVIERNVLEWRLDPASDARLPEAGSYDLRVIVMCSAGYTSSLAAASLQDLGLTAATDLAGGFQAWARDGLPVEPSPGRGGCLGHDICHGPGMTCGSGPARGLDARWDHGGQLAGPGTVGGADPGRGPGAGPGE
jgi:rhodanese-related sulfurtransferase